MTTFETFVLGLVQGFFGVIPVSADATARLLWRWGFGHADGIDPAAFAFFRLGTCLAILYALRTEGVERLRARPIWLGWFLLSAVPLAVFFPRMMFVRQVEMLAPWGALLTALFLVVVGRQLERPPERNPLPLREEPNATDALLLGLAVVASLCPGSSRLALVAAGALLCGVSRAPALFFAWGVTALAGLLEWTLQTLLAPEGAPLLSAEPVRSAVGLLTAFSAALVVFFPAAQLLRSGIFFPFAAWSAVLAVLLFLL